MKVVRDMHDGMGNHVFHVDPDGSWWAKICDVVGNTISYLDSTCLWPYQNHDEVGRDMYDGMGNYVFHVDPDGSWWAKTYDVVGNNMSYLDSTGFWFNQNHDGVGRVTFYEDSDGFVWAKSMRHGPRY